MPTNHFNHAVKMPRRHITAISNMMLMAAPCKQANHSRFNKAAFVCLFFINLSRSLTMSSQESNITHLQSEIDDLLDDIAQFRLDKGALKAAIAEAVELLTDPHITDGDIDEAIRLLKKAKDI